MATKTKASKAKAAKPAVKPSAPAVGKLMMISLHLIDPSKTNPRKEFNKAKLEELAKSIKEHGLINPITLRPVGKRYELVAGERRWRAGKLAKLTELPAMVSELDDKAVLEVQVIENLQRDDISPLEEAVGYEGLVKKHGYTPETLAARIGKSASYVHKRVKLTTLPAKAKTMLADGSLPLSHALLLARVHPDLQTAALAKFSWGSGALRPLKDCLNTVLAEFMLQLAKAPFDPKNADLVPAAGPCTTCPHRTGNQKELFDDVKATDICTKPPCFAEKVESWWKSYEPTAKKGCLAPVKCSIKESRQIFYETGDYLRGNDYVRASDHTYEMPERATYDSLIGTIATPYLALANGYQAVKLYKRSDAHAALKKSPKMKEHRAKTKTHRAKPESSNDVLEHRVERELEDLRYVHAGAIVPTDLDVVFRLLATETANMGMTDVEDIFRRRGLPEPKGWRQENEAIDKLIAESSGSALWKLLLELTGALSSYSDRRTVWLKALGIDEKELRKRAAVEAERTLKLEAEAKKAAKGKPSAVKPEQAADEPDDDDQEAEEPCPICGGAHDEEECDQHPDDADDEEGDD